MNVYSENGFDSFIDCIFSMNILIRLSIYLLHPDY